MDRDEYKQLKETGGLLADDAGQQQKLREATTEVTADDRYEEEAEAEHAEAEHEETTEVDADAEADVEEEEVELPEQQKDAFTKRLERERAKLEEKLRKELEEETERKYSKHKQAIEALGGDPDKLLAAAKEAQLQREAQALAERNGWNDEETKWYVDQQKQQQELKELRVQMQINKLKDQPDYLGIDRMEKDIMAKIDRSNGALTVEEAFWALGGPKRVEQVKLEAQQRELAKRAQQPRTVVRDTPSTQLGEKPLPPSVLAEAKRMGISETEARRLMNGTPAQTIDEFREKRKQAK